MSTHQTRLRRVARRALAGMALAGTTMALVLGALVIPGQAPGAASTPEEDPDPPNILLSTTDDQRVDDLRWMPLTRRALRRHGRSYSSAISAHPLCCPARAALLTGQYAQNNGVKSNKGPYGGWQALDPSSTIATWLSQAGYATAFHGKYVNLYPMKAPREPGWTYWDPIIKDIYDFRDFTMWNDGTWQEFENSYVTDVVARRTNRSIVRYSSQDVPFFIWTSHVAPHQARDPDGRFMPPVPARRHAQLFSDVAPPSLQAPNFNERFIRDQPGRMKSRPKVGVTRVVRLFRNRIRSLQAVDQAVASHVRTLRNAGELADTWIFFTSDNGMALGEHRLIGKDWLNSEVLDVPLLVRGPGVEAGTESDLRVGLVDLPVTIAALAGVDPPLVEDGQSFARDLRSLRMRWRDTHLVQTGTILRADEGWGMRGILTRRFAYGVDVRTGDRFLYDHRRDEWEQVNRVRRSAYAAAITELKRRWRLLIRCAGTSCNQRFGKVPGPQ